MLRACWNASYDISSPEGLIHGSKHEASNQYSEVSQVTPTSVSLSWVERIIRVILTCSSGAAVVPAEQHCKLHPESTAMGAHGTSRFRTKACQGQFCLFVSL